MKPQHGWTARRALAACLSLCALAALAIGAPAAEAQRRPAPPPPSAPEWVGCPDSATVDLRPDPGRDRGRIREIAPSAGARTAPELYTHARHAAVAYDLYAVFTGGGDPRAAFAVPGLRLVGLIWGDPGPQTDRGPPRRRDGRTLYGFVADEAATGRRYIVFRGTQEPAEWVRNAQAGQRPYPSGTSPRAASAQVHAGFLAIFESLKLDAGGPETAFAEGLATLVAGRETVFVGHSLGGALATLAGVDASRRAPAAASRLRVVTLASPRVGDAGFAGVARGVGRIDRVCNLVDAVPAVPPSSPRITYVHVGTPFRVSSFDWPALRNDLENAGEQIGCWHNHHAYTLMLQPNHRRREPTGCFR